MNKAEVSEMVQSVMSSRVRVSLLSDSLVVVDFQENQPLVSGEVERMMGKFAEAEMLAVCSFWSVRPPMEKGKGLQVRVYLREGAVA